MKYGFLGASQIQHQNTSFWQSITWSQILKESNQVQEVFYYGNSDSTFLFIEIRSVGLGFYAAFSLGISSFQIGDDWNEYLIDVQKVLRQKGVIFFQIEPIEVCGLQKIRKPYKKFLMPFTRIIDLTPTEDEIMAQMHQKGRYNIRLAIKKGVQVERVTSSKECLDIWMNLLNETLERDSFSGNNRGYYESFIKNIEIANGGGLYFARFEGRVIAAGIFVLTLERAIYYYGASSSNTEDRSRFAPYLLQWEVMKYAKSQGIKQYDLLGIAEPGNENDTLAGVSFFKARFGGRVVELPPKIYIPLSWKCSIFLLFQKIKYLLKNRY